MAFCNRVQFVVIFFKSRICILLKRTAFQICKDLRNPFCTLSCVYWHAFYTTASSPFMHTRTLFLKRFRGMDSVFIYVERRSFLPSYCPLGAGQTQGTNDRSSFPCRSHWLGFLVRLTHFISLLPVSLIFFTKISFGSCS